MLDIAKKLSEQDLLICLRLAPNVSDVVANDVQYHLICWMHFQKKVASENDDTIQFTDNKGRLIADIDIINIVQNALGKDADIFLDMKTLNRAYSNSLGTKKNFNVTLKST